MTTPGFSLIDTPQAVEFMQHLQLPMQLGVMLGNPDHFATDADVRNAIVNIHGKAKESGQLIQRLTQDATRTTPAKHEAAATVAHRLIAAAEIVHRNLSSRANDYLAASNEIMGSRFKLNPERFYHYDRITDWIARESKAEGGYARIREAITDDPDFALTMYNASHRLLGVPDEQVFKWKSKIVEHYAPDAMSHIDMSHKLSEAARRYPAFNDRVKASFYSQHELAKTQTRVEI